MSLVIEIPSDLEATLTEQAKTTGLSLQQFAIANLRRAAAENKLDPETTGKTKGALRLLELQGLGAEVWKDIGDAQEWLNKERDEWERTY